MLHKKYRVILSYHKPVLITLFSICIAFSSLNGQSAKDLKITGLDLVSHARYAEAIETLNKYIKQKPFDKEVLTALAKSYYYTNNPSESLRLLDLLIENNKIVDADWYYYKALNKHRQNDFLNAIRLYKLTITKLSKTDNRRAFIKDQIIRCSNGLKYERQKQNVFVDNLGEGVNSIYDEFAPFLSPNYDSKIYFASSRPNSAGGKRNDAGISDNQYGHYCSDMYFAFLKNGSWSNIELLSYMLNGPRNERIIGFTNKGNVMFFLRGFTEFSGDILVDTFKKNIDQIINPQYFESPIHSDQGDKDAYFINDSIMIFSSARSGGYGGMDLYITVHSYKGWTTPTNLGKEINTSYDETSPFLAKDGRTLYYSSNNLQSIGGFDVFKTIYDPKIFTWSIPENLGMPINSSDDDNDFKLNKDGYYAYFSSRRANSMGERDIYSAYFTEGLVCQSKSESMPPAFLPEFVNYTAIEKTLVEMPAKPKDKEAGKKEEKFNYTVNLAPIYYQDEYNILTGSNLEALNKLAEVMVQHPLIQLTISCHVPSGDNSNIETYLSLKRSLQISDYLVTKGVNRNQILSRGCGYNYPMVKTDIKVKEKSLQLKFNKRFDFNILRSNEAGVTVNKQDDKISKALLDPRGIIFNESQSGLWYRVQFAATKQPYNGSLLTDYNDLVIENRPSNDLNYYMVGLSKSYAEISEVYASLINKGKTDVFIVPYIDGWPVSKSQAQGLTKVYPDLTLYLTQFK